MKLHKIKSAKVSQKGRFMSLILRHKPEEANITLNKEGYVRINDLLDALNMSMNDLDWIVDTNDKKRFEYNEDKTLVRANRGHNKKLDIDIQLETIIPPEVLYHGTAQRFTDSIMKEGVKSMGRKYVHLSSNIDEAILVAKRHDKHNYKIIEINSEQMSLDGYKFQISSDEMYIIESVPSEYLTII